MGNGWHEWPLVLFTVLGQSVAGALIVCGVCWLTIQDENSKQRIVRSMFFLWLVMGIGFVASIIHLGSPLRAFNSLNRIGVSALSNEIAIGSIFFTVGGFWWLLTVIGKMPLFLSRLWLAISMLLGIAFVWAMTRVYQIDTVPTWHSTYTTLSFFLTVFLCGPLFAMFLLRIAGTVYKAYIFAALSVIALLVSLTIVILQTVSLNDIYSSVQHANTLVPLWGIIQAGRIVLITAGLCCWLYPLVVQRKEPQIAGLLFGVLFSFFGELLGRGGFYGLHMTVGMAVAG
ncbi:DmsC/YnfH family molybdoenzyme membrane anchor subunit [Citrobacter telavivensis]